MKITRCKETKTDVGAGGLVSGNAYAEGLSGEEIQSIQRAKSNEQVSVIVSRRGMAKK